MKKDIPLYTIHIDEIENMIVDVVSIVEHPAIQRDFLAFSKSTKHVNKYKFSDDEKMQLLGLALIPNEPIYRIDENGEEFYVMFTVEEIEKIVKVFMKNGLTRSMNIEHDPNKKADSFIFQTFITDDKIKAPALLGEVPNGSWVIGVQVEDIQLWNDIKAGKRNGFSVEGLFKLLETNKVIQEGDEKVEINITEIDEVITDEEIEKLYSQLENYFKYLIK